jgi:hypothetical protein
VHAQPQQVLGSPAHGSPPTWQPLASGTHTPLSEPASMGAQAIPAHGPKHSQPSLGLPLQSL